MVRTIDEAVHARRRAVFLDTARHLILTEGYERMSIQDVLDASGASRGAFYHYFQSKDELLVAVIERDGTAAQAALEPIADDPSLDALSKLRAILTAFGVWKTERRDRLLEVVRVWHADGNAAVRQRARQRSVATLTHLLERVIAQGAVEGAFDVDSDAHLARIAAAVLQELSDEMEEMLLAGSVPFDIARHTLSDALRALERLLGAPRGSIEVDSTVLTPWFGPADARRTP